MGLNTWKNIFFWFQIGGIVLALAAAVGNRIVAKRIEAVSPYFQKIKTASATVEIYIDSSEDVNNHFMDRGGYLALLKDNKQFFGVSSTDSNEFQQGNNTVLYRGIFSLDVSYPGFDLSIQELQLADSAEIKFLMIPEQCRVIKGRAIIIINGSIQLDIQVPPQNINNGVIAIPDINYIFLNFPRSKI
jgi:hypothetical protein